MEEKRDFKSIDEMIEYVAEKLSLKKNQSEEERRMNEVKRRISIENVNPDYK
jgi:hypothetical protein